MTNFSLKDHQFRPGDQVQLLIFNHPDHKTGEVLQTIQSKHGTYYKVRRADGREVDYDESDGMRLTPGHAYRYACIAGLDMIQAIKFLRNTYELSLVEVKDIIAREAGTTADEIQGRLAKELEPVLKD